MATNPQSGQSDRFNLPDSVHLKWDAMKDEYDRIMAKIETFKTQNQTTFLSGSGKTVDLIDFISTISSVIYKLYWACSCLVNLLEFYERQTGSKEQAISTSMELVPNDFNFNADVFFSFAYSALDITAEAIGILIETGIEERSVSLNSVLEYLAGSSYRDQMVDDMTNENAHGWIFEFRQYRTFVTHHGSVRYRSEVTFTTRDQTVDISLYMAPDDPRKRPLTYTKKRVLAPYCLEILERELPAITRLFAFINELI